ncbi:MAG TPA: hypothetical protein VIG39_10320 [Rhizomicrobium sp.]
MTGRARFFSAPRSARRWVTAVALLAFFLQNLAVQTHIHQSLQPEAVKVQTDGGHNAPLKLDPIDQCRLCQELVHAGTFLAPSATTSLLSLTFVAASITRVLAFTADPAMAFAWQSRAPPRR